MIDYLEELLPEEDGEELALELGGQLPRRRVEVEGEGQETGPAPGGMDAGPVVVEKEGRETDSLWAPLEKKGRREIWIRDMAGGQTGTDGPETGLPPVALGEEMASSGPEVAAAALLERLERARQVAGYGTGTGGSGVRLSVPQEETAVDSGLALEALDRAVQRDARRYDGGFALF